MTYRKTFILAALAAITAASLAAGCREIAEPEEGPVPAGNEKTLTFTCVIADEGSKVSVSEQGKTRWEAGDEIHIHTGHNRDGEVATVKLTASDISSDGKTATISFPALKLYDYSSWGTGYPDYYAAYPAGATDNPTSCYCRNYFSNTNNVLMAACDNEGTFKFYNLCGLISFEVSGDFDSYTFSGNGGEVVGFSTYAVEVMRKSQNFRYVSSSGGISTSGELSEISGTLKDGVNIVGIPTGADFTGGFTFKFFKNGNLVKVAKSVAPVNVARGKLLPLGDLSSHLKDPSASDTHQSGIDTSAAIDLGAEGTANCYIIGDPGIYKFRAVKGNSSESVGSVASVEVLWETACTEDAPAKGSIVSAVDFQDNFIYLQTPDSFNPGNALIAAKNGSGEIIWSWHIWIPASTIDSDTYSLSTAFVMDRNLGALNVAKTSGTVDPTSFGLLYQWGRKDPFPGMKGFKQKAVVGVTGAQTSINRAQVSTEEAIANPTQFSTLNNSDWNIAEDNDLWGGTSKKKTKYDPCPPGYKVPMRSEASSLFTSLFDVKGWTDNAANGWFAVGSPSVSFPLAGYIDDYITSAGSYSYPGSRASFWSADGSGNSAHAQDLRMDTDPTVSRDKSNAKARGASVRCISEDAAPFVNEPGMPVMESYTRTEFTKAQLGEISGLCFSKDGDFMWGVGDKGYLYKIGFDMSVSVQIDPTVTSEADFEGVTIDPITHDLYFCCEPNRVRKSVASGYNTLTKIFEVADAADFGNSGLEGITYYKDNILYVGSQSGACLWAYNVNGTVLWKKQLGTIAPGILEVGDLYYDSSTDLLWVSDSEAFKVFVFDGAVTTIKAIYDISFIGNPEAILVDHERGCVWIGDDRGGGSRIYKVIFSNLGDGGTSQAPTQTLCKEECLGQKPMVVAYLTEYTSASSLDADYVTHINYAHGRFGNPSTGDGGIVISETSLLNKVLALKNKKPSLKVLLMVGGWGAKANGFSQMAADPAKRTAFCQSCLSHIRTYGLDGIDIDWEYPTYSAEGNAASPDDTQNFNLVLKELRETIGDTKIISFASTASAKYVDWATAINYIDYVNVMTYAMGSAPETHNSPLYSSSTFNQRSCSKSVELHLAQGIPLNRQNLGVPFYGKGYKGGDSKYPDDIYKIYPYEVDFHQMADIFNKNTVTGRRYNEDNKVTVDVTGKNIRHWDDTAKVPYLTDTEGHILLCYDDAESVAWKGRFVRENGLLGAMFWEYRHDDAEGTLRRTLYNAVYNL